MPRRPDEDRRAEARRLYAMNIPTRTIAEQLKADPRTVQRWLGNETRRRGRRKNPAVPDAKIRDMREKRGLSYREIAALTGMSVTGVRMRYYALTGRERPDRTREG